MTCEYPTVEILGSGVHRLSFADAIGFLERLIQGRDGVCHQVVVTGFHGLWEAHKDQYLYQILNGADLWVADGIAPVLLARLRQIRDITRIPGAELMEGYFERANRNGYRSFFYGDTVETLDELTRTLERRFPGHEICGTLSPPFRCLTPEEDDEIVEQINTSNSDVVWVGLGTPKQDKWIFEHKDRLNAPVAVGVGAAFRFHAGIVKRVPKVIGDMGLEWIWRLAMEPRKLWRRDIIAGPQFLLHAAMELLGLRRYGRDMSGYSAGKR
ncbi:WecB/TagA/CpsF family glycosyltransferase [Anaerobaca lacustris]|uniref:WecB/TagA/CpsF family glycosyltransferase n=1 Tax=Anaerobaca lacustris TaxID=3044600 RepID=A0AAW6U9Q0_9BACT|nr:WecB/TagA/CpsF family glycosyltransferase [Sedimentisphaerales bacterium M17dextr]